MPEFSPMTVPVNFSGPAAFSPNIFEHVAVHPAVYSMGFETTSIPASSTRFLTLNSSRDLISVHITNFWVWDFSLYRKLAVWLQVEKLSDLILEVASEVGKSFVTPGYEERRWALNVGSNFIEHKVAGRYGRFKIQNREAAAMGVDGNVVFRTMD